MPKGELFEFPREDIEKRIDIKLMTSGLSKSSKLFTEAMRSAPPSGLTVIKSDNDTKVGYFQWILYHQVLASNEAAINAFWLILQKAKDGIVGAINY